MNLKDIKIAVVITVMFTFFLLMYGYRPRAGSQIATESLAPKTMEQQSAHLTSVYEFGPEDHPGFFDYLPEDVPVESNRQIMLRAIRAMEVEESNGNSRAVGDLHLVDKAYGILQIRKPYLDDVNQFSRAKVFTMWGRLLTMKDMKDPKKARWVAEEYLTHYGKNYHRQTGKQPDIRAYAALHNGGPLGWQKESTNEYCNRVAARAEKMAF